MELARTRSSCNTPEPMNRILLPLILLAIASLQQQL